MSLWSDGDMARVDSIVKQISFNDWRINWHAVGVRGVTTMVYLQVSADGKCNVTGQDKSWTGRKWHLSKWMTDGEIVQTAFLAVMTATEHETREQFKYMGQSVFDPHYDMALLVEFRKTIATLHQEPPK